MTLGRLAAVAAFCVLALTGTANAAPALWEVSDADSKVWLFGSMHVLPPTITWRTPAIETALTEAEQVYFEADIGPLGQIGIMLKGIGMAFNAPKTPWTDKLTASQTQTLAAAIEPLGLTMPQLAAYAPWLAEGVVEDKVMTGMGFRGNLGVDATLQAELPKEKKAFFESAGQQIDMMGADSEEVQIRRLLAAIAEIDKMPAQLDSLAEAWASGNDAAITAQMADDPGLDQAFEKTMLLDRNQKWTTAISALLAQNHQDLIVVGAAHLVGDGSVTDLLGKAGFTVRRIQ